MTTPAVIEAAIKCIHTNPVRRGLVKRAVDWKWWSASWYLLDPPRQQRPGLPLPNVAGFFMRGRMAAMLKYLRIAVTAFSLVACVLLIVLWVRSYWYTDQIVWRYGSFASFSGRLLCAVNETRSNRQVFLYTYKSERQQKWLTSPDEAHSFRFQLKPKDNLIGFPYWLPLLLVACLALVPWLNCRFSLRTLLIATTLIAVGLGIIIWAAR